jgi:hypothetical protein
LIDQGIAFEVIAELLLDDPSRPQGKSGFRAARSCNV